MSCCAAPSRWMRKKTASMVGTGAVTSCQKSWPLEGGRLEKIRQALAAVEAEARAEAERAAAAGKDHFGVPDDKAQRNFTDAASRNMPAPG